MTLDDPGYPVRLRALDRPPARLWVAGAVPERCVAMVGSRRPDLGGLRAARDIAAGLARAGLAIVSGGAVGIDAMAIGAALEAGGRAVIVLGSGIDKPYPRESVPLMLRAAASGCVVSQFPPDADPFPGRFHLRNRVIAALAEAVVVVRAGARSGALSTADHAFRLGRPVLAVPGSTSCESAAGSNALLRRGCRPAIDASDVMAAVRGAPAADAARPAESRDGVRAAPRRAGVEGAVLALLSGGDAVGADDLAEAVGLPAAAVAAALGVLEAEGAIARTVDGRFVALFDGR